jgi:hypothetical protein
VVHASQIPGELRSIEGCAKEEAQRRGRAIERRRPCTVLGHVHLEPAYVLRACRVGRPPRELGKFRDLADIVPDRRFAELAYRHVLERAAAKFADGLLAHR